MDKNNGYKGYSMSKRAVQAYSEGEMPKSKWSKAVILEKISDITDADLFKKLTLLELQKLFLRVSSWHHTGKFAKATDFYSLDENEILAFTKSDVDAVIARRIPRKSKTSKEKAEKAHLKEEKLRAEAEKKELENLFKYHFLFTEKPCKTLNGFIRRIESGKVDLDALRELRQEKIIEKREQLRDSWNRQGYQYGLEHIDDDGFIDMYIRIK